MPVIEENRSERPGQVPNIRLKEMRLASNNDNDLDNGYYDIPIDRTDQKTDMDEEGDEDSDEDISSSHPSPPKSPPPVYLTIVEGGRF